MKLSGKEKISYGLGAVGKDMVYMLSASFVLYYYQDILGVSALVMGIILLATRVFDAFNDPIMGVIVAKTKTKWGKFRPWLLIGTVTNAVILYALFAAPPSLSGTGLVVYASVIYVLWSVTYTMMDIPFWSMIPAFTEGGQAIIENMDLSGENAVYGELAEGKSLALNTNNSIVAKKDDESYAIVNYGDLEITGNGTITTQFKGSIESWGKLYINNLNIDVSGDTYGLHVKDGEAEINNLTVTAERGALNFRGGSTTVINSGSYTYSAYYDEVRSAWASGQMVYAVGENTEVIINGGDFRYSGGNNGSQRVLCAQDGAVIKVYGGTFGNSGAKKKSTWLWELDLDTSDAIPTGDIIVYGGKFQFDPSKCVAEGYEAVKGADGWYNVVPKTAG
jgi:hypothetical protein